MKISSNHYAMALHETVEESPEGKMEMIVKNFVKVVFNNGDGNKIDDIIFQFNKVWNKKHDITEAEIVTARKIDKKLTERVKQYILQKTNAKTIDIKENIDEKILGGIIIKYDDYITDFSLTKKVKEFTKTIKK